jgi:hypothetical protein
MSMRSPQMQHDGAHLKTLAFDVLDGVLRFGALDSRFIDHDERRGRAGNL